MAASGTRVCLNKTKIYTPENVFENDVATI